MFEQQVFYKEQYEDYVLVNLHPTFQKTMEKFGVKVPKEPTVKELLAEGWELYGSPIACDGDFYQAMVKPKEEEEQ